MIYVTKADGSKQLFDKQKIILTCINLGLKYEQAIDVSNEIEKKIYDGIHTRKILQMIFKIASNYKPNLKHRIDLRESISLLRPKPDFEKFVSLILKELGYEIQTNLIIPGKCVEHEIDIVAVNKEEYLLVEVKHHVNPHTIVPIDVFLEVNSVFEDIKEGFYLKKHSFNFTNIFVICNTKISSNAVKYAICKNIKVLAWKYPIEKGLEKLIEEKKLYPITILKDIEIEEAYKLFDIGILTLKQLLSRDSKEIYYSSKINLKRINYLQEKAKLIMEM
ncbi:MAG: hypothetical protein RMJ17_00965 [Candidatus Aenigmarchaeota archaeon]|nr:hypothetical protein [Candidatus Aenigmarchaeota archaeon]MDW8149156.1 hypothetical protein [Candidatus Aenigmarchaeota archaeon]